MSRACNFYGFLWRLDRLSRLSEVVVVPKVSTAFPVHEAEVQDETTLELNYLTLLGADSPLPHYLLTLGLSNDGFQAFLALFNQRIAKLLYLIWRQTHPLANAQAIHHVLSACLGESNSQPQACQLYLRTAQQLRWYLQAIFQKIPVNLREFSPRWYAVQSKKLGEQCQLNHTAVLGHRVYDAQFGLTIEIGPVPNNLQHALAQFKAILKAFYSDFFIIIIVIRAPKILPVQLGHSFVFKSSKQMIILDSKSSATVPRSQA